tara:strand:- start:331 stop:558 length:228 start_codon:yes stop_codon:yes gene_type:complete
MAVPLKIKIPWWKKYHPRALWHRMKISWVTGPSVKENFKRDKYGYLIILAGVALSCLLVGVYFLFWNISLSKYGH